jgi:hypothetical protein
MRNPVTENRPPLKSVPTKIPDRKSRGAEPKFGQITF